MREKDIVEKRLEDYADVFADIVNVLLFDGEEKIRPADLKAALPRSIYKADGKLHEQERDAAKYWIVNGVKIALIGLENQSSPEMEMPVRVLSYDGASYRTILNHRDDAKRKKKPVPPIYPVITLVLYFGTGHWNYRKNLKDIFEIPEGFEPYVSDYEINVFEISYLPDETVEKFKSDFRWVAELFTQQRKISEGIQKDLQLSGDELDHAKETLELLRVLSGDNRFEMHFNKEEGSAEGVFVLFDILEERAKKAEREKDEAVAKAEAEKNEALEKVEAAEKRIKELEAILKSRQSDSIES